MAKKDGFWTTLLVLTVIGAINWGLVGFFNWNLVDALFGAPASMETTTASRIVYALVGLAGLGIAFMAGSRRSRAGTTSGAMPGRHREVGH